MVLATCSANISAVNPDKLSMNEKNAREIKPAAKHERYRTFGACSSFAEADTELRDYWWSRTPEERMEALEELRIRVYGEEKINARIPRIFGVPERRGS